MSLKQLLAVFILTNHLQGSINHFQEILSYKHITHVFDFKYDLCCMVLQDTVFLKHIMMNQQSVFDK